MTEPEPASTVVEGPKRSFWRNLSLVWLVPLAALAVTLFIAWQSWAERGTVIEISFENAAGITPEETLIRYRDVNIGVVEDVSFSSDLAAVVVHARIDRTVAGVLPENAQFWVVRPEVSASGITGLSTVLSGVYIQAAFSPQEDARADRFEGMEEAPLVLPGMRGTRVTLRTRDGGQITAGAPIYYRGIEVGKIEAPRLDRNGEEVIVDAFINAPHDRRLTTATRFWQTSGFSVNFGPQGLDLSVGSIAGLIRGGLSFDTVFSGGQPVEPGQIFDLYESEQEARSSVFNEAIENPVDLSVEFEQSVAGLTVGSPVVYKGVRIGAVSTLGAFVEGEGEDQTVILRAVISIDPGRLGLDPEAPPAETIAFFANAVHNGLRARLVSQSIFSRTLAVELAEIPEAAPETLGIFAATAPLLPSVVSNLPDAAATAEGLLNRVDNLPVEELMDQAIATLASIETLAGDENLRAAPDAFVGLMNDARGIVGSDDAQALPGELRAIIGELRGVAEELRAAEAVNRLVAALDAASEAADTVSEVAGSFDDKTSAVPQLLEDLDTLTQKANSLEVEQFLAMASAFLDGADRLIDQESTRALPESLTGALDEAQAALAELRGGGVVENANATFASAREAARAVEEAAADLPAIATRLDGLVGEAEGVLSGYGQNSRFNRETLEALRELRSAAQALSSLARTLERNPNSILFGR
ncbi:MlaD family protein [Celeribacter indicus]|uniref:Paraquat-inducible protein B n=1 Tax=Celeribacter indicus TaxID=1208324 RepID=A0A0B5DXT2_9RHOB|nr:MlaD family protein [Celeribacter indicus]AJE47809.1 paraquat-inducible protein B [Celeribacter indicus]SDW23618.1 paraquat-inducible protein B [Celeribacter indicus]